MTNAKNLRRSLKLAALASASLVALPAHAATDKTQSLGLDVLSLVNVGTTTTVKPVKPQYGNIRPFYGNIRSFYGNIRPFYGNIRPFWGNIRPFWGDTGAFYGDLKSFWALDNPVQNAPGAPSYLKVGDFWSTTGAAYDATFTQWNTISPTATSNAAYQPIANQLKSIVDGSRTFWGGAVQAQTGKSFDVAFANPLLAKYGIDLSRPSSLAELDQTDRALFFLDWYDGLMDYVGTDHVDHWMKAINWTPSLTKTQGAGYDSVIGILDQTVVGDATIRGNVVKYAGVSSFTNGHGAAVGSLIVGAHDGKGVMGIAPGASVIAYNPYDASGTANWSDITKGVQMLKASGANVVNMSLGVPGTTLDQGWNDVFSDLNVILTLKNTVFVIAAGNEGVTQSNDVKWSPLNPAILVVGSVGLDGQISNFSNRPGDACLTTLFLCLPGNDLKDRFLVAPGELILVSDGEGGLARQTGTSLAAPLVSGAVALLQDRWPWLVNYPRETADIILKSAKDLGAPGVDEVYGHGLLDVTASQSPLDFNKLIWFTVEDGQMKLQTQNSVLQTYRTAQSQPATWDARNAYFYAFELIGLTNRDFAIPLSQKLVGQNVTTYMGAKEQFQSYLLARMGGWAASKGALVGQPNGFFPMNVDMTAPWGGAEVTFSFAPRQARAGFRDEGPAYQSAVAVTGEKARMMFGFGDGAAALVSQPGFNQAADYDGETGGANPLLGFASGGVYAGGSYALTERLSVSAGLLARSQERDHRVMAAFYQPDNGAERYSAAAQQLAFTYKAAANLTLSSSFTHLDEATGLLGVQSLDAADFRKGSVTDGLSFGAAWAPSKDWTLAATGTLGHTRASDGQTLSVEQGGLTTSAFQAAVTRANLLARGDALRLTVAQPLFVERGKLTATTVQIVDRSTGEIGIGRQTFDVGDSRRLSAELLYAAPVSDQADVTFFGRVEGEASSAKDSSYLAGARYRIAF